jgi:hypothetical protein
VGCAELQQIEYAVVVQQLRQAVVMGLDQAVEAQGTHRGDGLEVGLEAHQFGQDGAADSAAALPQVDRQLPQIRWSGQHGQPVELGFQQASFFWASRTQHLKAHRFCQMGRGIKHVMIVGYAGHRLFLKLYVKAQNPRGEPQALGSRPFQQTYGFLDAHTAVECAVASEGIHFRDIGEDMATPFALKSRSCYGRSQRSGTWKRGSQANSIQSADGLRAMPEAIPRPVINFYNARKAILPRRSN